MKLLFKTPFDRKISVHSRRGENTYRRDFIPAETTEYDYNALPNCVVELTCDSILMVKITIGTNTGAQFNVEKFATIDGRKIEPRLAKTDIDDVQSVGGELRGNGEALSGADVIPSPSVDEGNARLTGGEERRSEGSPDGLHRDNDESSILHDRPVEGIGSVPAPVQDAGRDGLLSNEVRPSVGNVPVSGQPVLGREEHGDKTSGSGDSVYSWKQLKKRT